MISEGCNYSRTLLTPGHTSRNPYTFITHTFWLLQNSNSYQNWPHNPGAITSNNPWPGPSTERYGFDYSTNIRDWNRNKVFYGTGTHFFKVNNHDNLNEVKNDVVVNILNVVVIRKTMMIMNVGVNGIKLSSSSILAVCTTLQSRPK